MKKMVILALVVLFATPAFAVIDGSKHDMVDGVGINWTAATNNFTGTEPCQYCHAPHNSLTAAPLWNRLADAQTGVGAYGNPGGSINATLTADSNLGDVWLCLSCHDGTVSASVNYDAGTAVGSGSLGGDNTITAGAASIIGGAANALANDHPVGFVFSDDGGFNVAATTALLKGSGNTEMWCASCHNPHESVLPSFLRIDNSTSGLCTTCHAK